MLTWSRRRRSIDEREQKAGHHAGRRPDPVGDACGDGVDGFGGGAESRTSAKSALAITGETPTDADRGLISNFVREVI